MRFPHVEKRSNRRPAVQNVADRFYQPEGASAMDAKVQGVVKFFNPDKGYGFIRRDGGQDVFVHANELRRSGIMDLSPITTGQKLEFEVVLVQDRGPKATNIKMVAEAPVVASSAAV